MQNLPTCDRQKKIRGKKRKRELKTRHVHSGLFCHLQAITTGGVTYQEKPWHRECFLCISCRKQLSGQRFTTRENYPYCLECFSNLYAKKCVSCTKPITSEPPCFVFCFWAVTEMTWALSISDVCRSCRGKVHLLWGAPVAQWVFHLHAVLHFPGGTRLPHSAWQHLVHRLQQGKVKIPLVQFIISPVQRLWMQYFIFCMPQASSCYWMLFTVTLVYHLIMYTFSSYVSCRHFKHQHCWLKNCSSNWKSIFFLWENANTAGAGFSLNTSFAIARTKQVCKVLKSSKLGSCDSSSTPNAKGCCSMKFYFLKAFTGSTLVNCEALQMSGELAKLLQTMSR